MLLDNKLPQRYEAQLNGKSAMENYKAFKQNELPFFLDMALSILNKSLLNTIAEEIAEDIKKETIKDFSSGKNSTIKIPIKLS